MFPFYNETLTSRKLALDSLSSTECSFPIDHYTKEIKRSLATIEKCALLSPSSPLHRRLGVQNKPIFAIEPDSVVIDELHLFMRIFDILIRNLIYELINRDHHSRRATDTPFIKTLEATISESGVTFRVWEKRDASGKPSGNYAWTSLKGSDMKKVLQSLPPHFSSLLRAKIQEIMAKIWMVRNENLIMIIIIIVIKF